MEKPNMFTPLYARETEIFMAFREGGFSVRHCPNPINFAAFIVCAVNSHDELLEALEKSVKAYHQKTRHHDKVGGQYHNCEFSECTAPFCRDNRALISKARGTT